MENSAREHFGDEDTLFIFTSDHGFPNVGGHGSNYYKNRELPFLLWGSPVLNGGPKDCKKEISQLQVSSLIAGILGTATPANNIGIFPSDLLGEKDEETAPALVSFYGQQVNQLCAWIGKCLPAGF